MAEVKWIKLSTNMFEDEKIKLIRKMPEGNNILVVWIYLLVLAGKCNAGGYIFLAEDIPYTDEMLSTVVDMPLNTVRLALKTFGQLRMIELDEDNRIYIVNWEKHQNIEGLERIREQNRLRQQRYRERQKALKEKKKENNKDSNVNVTLHNAIEEDRDIDREEDKDIEEDEEERVLSLENSDKVPSLCQEEDDPVLEFLNQVSSYYTTLTGRLTSPNDEVAITDIAKHTNDFELVKEAMNNTFRNYKPRYKGDKIRGFRYFVPGILERIAIEKERQKRREVKVANGNDFLGTETERTPKFDKSKFLYQGNE